MPKPKLCNFREISTAQNYFRVRKFTMFTILQAVRDHHKIRDFLDMADILQTKEKVRLVPTTHLIDS